MSQYAFRSIIDGGADSANIYYNATLTSTRTSDLTLATASQPIRFNETRDAPIVKDASQYDFSIIRFTMNGPCKNLPLFIPLIQTNGNISAVQTNPNLTVYYTTLAYQREWNYTVTSTGLAATQMITITPPSTPITYISETQNSQVAPIPSVPVNGIIKQDLNSRYYWIYTYKHFVQLVNNAIMASMADVYTGFQLAWAGILLDSATASPYPTFASFLLDQDVPVLYYDEDTGLFEIYGDTRCFNVSGQMTQHIGPPQGLQGSLPAFTPPAYAPGGAASPSSACYMRLFFNDLLFGLLSNFNNTFLGVTDGGSLVMPLTQSALTTLTIGGPTLTPYLYTNEILFTNQQYKNILNNNPTLQNVNSVPPPIFNPFFLIPTSKQNLYWIAKQDYKSTDTLWSPVANIVFTSALLPLKREYNAAPVELDQSNTSGKSVPAQSSFEPLICDFSVDQQIENAQGYRGFQLYEPTAEYRMVSTQASHEEIRNIDIQVFWRYRLTGELIPLTMASSSDVTIKMLFRKRQ